MSNMVLPKFAHPDFARPDRKPVGPVAIDWSNPLTKGLKRAYFPQLENPVASLKILNLVTGDLEPTVVVSANPTDVFDPRMGKAVSINSPASGAVRIPAIGDTGGNGTVFALHRAGSSHNAGPNLIFSHADFGANHRLYLGYNSTTGYYFRLGSSAAQTGTLLRGSISTGQLRSFAISWQADQTKAKGYVDGLVHATWDRGASEPGSSANRTSFGYDETNASASGATGVLLIYDRQLSDAEQKALHDNPYQLLKPVNELLLFYPSSSADSLLAEDLTSSTSVTTPALGQTHGLNANDVASATSVTSPAIGQVHNLLADDVSSASSVTTPALSETHALLVDDISSATSVDTPAIGQVHALAADDITSASSVGSPAIGQTHGLLADDVSSASAVDSATLGQTHGLLADDVSSTSSVTAPALGTEGTDALLAEDVTSSSSVSSPQIGQVHGLTADDVASASSVDTPSLGVISNLLAEDVSSASSVSTPVLAEVHVLYAEFPTSNTSVSQPVIGQIHALSGNSLQSSTSASSPYLGGVSSGRIITVPTRTVTVSGRIINITSRTIEV